MNRAVISLGSNIDAEANINKALDALARSFDVRARSRITKTRPIGFVNQPDFLNGVVFLDTELELVILQNQLKAIEIQLGRQKRENRWGPREVDLDVLIWNDCVVNKDFYERDFLQKAVAEILPDMKLRCC